MPHVCGWEMAATMQSEGTQGDAATRATSGTNRLSRRQAIGRMSVVATAGAAAWVVPEILTAKAAGSATLSAPAVLTGASTPEGALAPPGPNPATNPPGSLADTLAFTGLNIQRDAEVGAALIAGGWALRHWASRTSTPPTEGPGAPA
jgi:hypothetical protein